MTPSDRVAQRVQSLRRRRGMSRDDLADACQRLGAPATLTAASVANIETGRPKDGTRRRAVTVDELILFAEVFSVTPTDLLAADLCEKCCGAPPAGFTCNSCGASNEEPQP